jgi:creatinine amidohydrolase/Fe(II)-dependent formamide hydrolase-like protein
MLHRNDRLEEVNTLRVLWTFVALAERAAPRINNGITGDARRPSAALGKMLFDMKVDYAAKQIQGFLGQPQQAAQPR